MSRAPRKEAARARTMTAPLLAIGTISVVLVLLLDGWLTAQLDDPRAAFLVSVLMVTGFMSFLSIAGHPHARSRSRANAR